MFKEEDLDKKTDEIVKKTYKKYLTKNEFIQKKLNFYSFKKKNKREYFDLDKYFFKLGKNYHTNYFFSFKKQKEQENK